MRRGTTPTVKLTITSPSGEPCDLTDCEIHVTFEGAGKQIVKRESDISVMTEGGATVLGVDLTQEETLSFPEGRKVRVQVRAKDGSGRAIASSIAEFMADEILEEGVI